MSKGKAVPPVGTAIEGVCVVPPSVWANRDANPETLSMEKAQVFTIQSIDSLKTREERTFYDWSVGILEDAGVVGVLKNDYVYQASALHGEIDTGAGAPYVVALSWSSVEFDFGEADVAPIEFSDAVVETEADEIEASQVGRAFRAARRESALIRAWKDSTSMAGTRSILFRDLRIHPREGEIAMDIETDALELTITVRRTQTPGVFRYALTGREPILNSVRVADAILCDVAEETGGVPSPSAIILAMIGAADVVQSDPEWLAAGHVRRGLKS
ncbi:hypothetical protein NG702_19080 [Pseudarthrobacter sp. MDT3-28]|uniref:hypothetical protein n=1 Tax=Pseudarthrobacter raffinosi TaxID=2953651 RepID=UPI00208FDD75|nr:hypothetical protein [Pseudarthrobacter sp. MDT3-28]MCO4239481.1 hypothetical protein [Pseudarthrobacter sp. MDT3-28]